MMKARGASAGERLSLGDIELEVIRRGAGRPILLLHGMQNILVMIGRSGFMTHAEAEKNIKLFAQEVLPRLKEIAPATVG